MRKLTNKQHSRLGRLFKKKRLEANLSQEEVTKRLFYESFQIVSKWEKGFCSPTVEDIKELIKLYGLSKEEVLEAILEETKEEYKFLLGIKKNKVDL